MIEESGEAETVGEIAYRKIRSDIIFGRLKPEAKLRLEALRKDYNISVTTLREIFNRLTSEGFITAEGQKGFRVASVSERDLRELAELRILIEGYALRGAIANGDLEWEAAIVAAHYRLQVMESRMLAGDTSIREQWKNADWQFHRALISGAGSRVLLDVHASVFDKYLRYQMISLTYRGEIAAREHTALKDAALARDAATAVKILEKHIAGGVEDSVRRSKEKGLQAAE